MSRVVSHQGLSVHAVSNEGFTPQRFLHPAHQTFAQWYDRYMYLVIIMYSIMLFPQAALVLRNKNSENISLATFIMFLIAAVSGLVYGVLWKDMFLALTGLVATSSAILVLVAITSYENPTTPGAFSRIG